MQGRRTQESGNDKWPGRTPCRRARPRCAPSCSSCCSVVVRITPTRPQPRSTDSQLYDNEKSSSGGRSRDAQRMRRDMQTNGSETNELHASTPFLVLAYFLDARETALRKLCSRNGAQQAVLEKRCLTAGAKLPAIWETSSARSNPWGADASGPGPKGSARERQPPRRFSTKRISGRCFNTERRWGRCRAPMRPRHPRRCKPL